MKITGRDRSFAFRLGGALAVPVFIHTCYVADHPEWTGFSVPMFALVQIAVLVANRSFSLALLGWSVALIVSAGLALGSSGVELEIPMLALPTLLNLIFFVTFGRTLIAGREPLITRICRFDLGSVPPELAHYTRRLTVGWTGLFALAAVGSLVLACLGQQVAWSWFSNVASPLAMVTFFVGEHVYRHRRFGRASLARTLAIMTMPQVWSEA